MTTQYIFLPPLGAVPIYATPADLPSTGTLGEIVSVISDGTIRQWNGSVWAAISGLAAVGDTDSIDLTNTTGTVTADLNLSAAAAGAGNDKITLSIESDGLLAQTVSKVPLTRFVDTLAPLAGGGDLSADRTLSISLADTATDGYLSSTDWNTFNDKVPATRDIATTAPLAGGGDLSANRTLSITQATTSTDGYLSSTDWNTFNNKQQAITIGAVGAGDANGITLSSGTLSLQAATNSLPGILTATAQTIGGSKTFNNNLLKANNATNASFVGLVAPSSSSFASATDGQTATATLGGSNAYLFEISLSTGESILCQTSNAVDAISALSDLSGLFLTSDAGTGIYVFKSTSSNVISIKNRMGSSRDIGVVFFGNTVTASTVWA